MAWYACRIAFRKRDSKNPSFSCGQRDLQLYLEMFTGLAKTACQACGSADHFLNSCPLAPLDQQCKVAILPTFSAEIPTATKPASPNRTNPAAMEHIPPLTMTQSLTDTPDKRLQRR